MKLVPDQSHSAAEQKILEERGFIVIEVASYPSFKRALKSHLTNNRGGLDE
jgi:hypothetical protein